MQVLDNRDPVDSPSEETNLKLCGLQKELHWVLKKGRSVLHCSAIQSYTLSKMIAVCDSTRDVMIEFEGFEYIVNVMELLAFSDNAEIQEKACWCLAAFCRRHGANKRHASQCGALTSVLKVIERFNYHSGNGNPRLFQKAFAALVEMSSDIDENRKFIGEEGGISSVLYAMETFHFSSEMSRWGAAMLATVCIDSEENARKVKDQYGIKRLVTTLNDRLNDEVTVLWVSKAMRNMSIVEGVVESFYDEGAKDLVQKALAIYSTKQLTETESLLQECLRLLLKIDSSREEASFLARRNFESGKQESFPDTGYSSAM
eukprot:m.271555 g.271555  ORF g.271555 m.271555 type:complete len:316 (+) comp40551_c0_seq10:1766-2713(+)